MTAELQALIEELDAVLMGAPRAECLRILQRVSDLWVEFADACSADQTIVFDEVMGRLIGKVDQEALSELSRKLAPLGRVPDGVLGRLAAHEDIDISGPLLRTSASISDAALADLAGKRSDKHLAAIAARDCIGELVAEILVARGSAETARRLAENAGTQLSDLVFVKLIHRAKGDRSLAAAIEARADLPPELQPFLRLAAG